MSRSIRTVPINSADIRRPAEAQFTLSPHETVLDGTEHMGKMTLTVQADPPDPDAVDSQLCRFRLAQDQTDLSPGEDYVASVSMGHTIWLLIRLPAIPDS